MCVVNVKCTPLPERQTANVRMPLYICNMLTNNVNLAGQSVIDIAKTIYCHFDVGQRAIITGKIGQQPVGLLVLAELEAFDRIENIRKLPNGRFIRRHKKEPNSVGGYLAHKIFKYAAVFPDGEPKYTIWRIQ